MPGSEMTRDELVALFASMATAPCADSSWLLEMKNESEPMFLSFFIPVGVFLLMAARRPSEHRSMIALAAWLHISHGTVMSIQTVEAWNHGVHRNFTDVILFLVVGGILLALLPAKRKVIEPVLV